MKKIMTLFLVMLLMAPVNIMAEEKDDKNDSTDNGKTTETVDDLVTDLPIDKEVSGAIYGSIYKENDDIIIDVPDDPDDNNNNNNNGGNNNNNNNNNNNGNSNGGNNGGSSNHGSGGNRPDNNQSDYGISTIGTDEKDSGIVYYKWVREKKTLEIYPAMFDKAKKEKKNIIMRVVDVDDKSLEYRLRIRYEDFKEVKMDTLKFEFGEKCEHKTAIEELLISAEARSLLQCKQEALPIPVYIGVSVPDTWDHSYGVYQYEYDQKNDSLTLIRKDLQIDEENVVEILLEKEKDYVFYHHSLPVMKHNLLTWVSGLSGKIEIVDQGNALISFLLFLTGFILIGGALYVVLDRRRKQLKAVILEADDDHEEGGEVS